MTPRSEDDIRRARDQLLSQGLQRFTVPSSLIPEDIEQSWRRSASVRVDPAAEPRMLGGEIDPDSSVLRAAGRVLDQWQDSLSDSRLALLLADQDGRIVSRRVATHQEERHLDRVSAVEGFDYSEGSLGTNGLGTPIEARDVVFVRGSEHFNEALAELACAGAPVRHPITGRIVGSIALASPVTYAHDLMVSVVRQVGTQIAEELASQADSRDMELARIYRMFRSTKNPVLVMNDHTVMTDLPTLSHLDTESHALLWDQLMRHSWHNDSFHLELPLLGTVVTARRLGKPPQEPIFVLEFTEPLTLPVNALPAASADAVKRTSPGTAESTPATPSNTPDPYEPVRQALDTAATSHLIIRVQGAPGVGKRHQATRWLTERTQHQPLVIHADRLASAADPKAREVWAAAKHALNSQRGIIITHATTLADATRAALEHLATKTLSLDRRARIVIAEQQTAETTQSSTDQDVVTVPSLAELSGSFPAIIRQVAAVLFPNEPPLRFAPAALQAFLTWPWPGNVAELSEVLSNLSPTVRAGLIQVQDLPQDMRQAGPRLNRYEQFERDTIIAALRDAQWNKSRAADILGIGRTTLYRKMRSLKITDETQA
ncbi:MAG TPA: helix-turn-helix domain-containing protein [Enteractinococcus sp.]